MRRPILSAAAPACLLLGLSPLSASADVAPPGTASGAAAQVSGLAGISSTGAEANPSKADAHAAVVSIGGQPALNTGGTQTSDGESGGALLDTGASAPARVEVAPWRAAAHGTSTSDARRSQASAAAARVTAPGVANVGVLTSDAQAEHTATRSTGTSSTDALDLGLGDSSRLVLLHSEVGSTGQGQSYLVGLNGTKIGTDEQLGKSCALDAAGVARLACLTASGGLANGVTSGAAEVLGVQTALGLDPVSAFAASASSGTGTLPSILPAVAAPMLPAVDTARAVTPAPTGAALPRTGTAAASLAASGLAALLSGRGLRRFGRRRR